MMKLIFLFALLQDPSKPVAPAKIDHPGAPIKRGVPPLLVALPEEGEPLANTAQRAPEAESQRNQNIQINLIDNNALNESLARQGIQPVPARDFTAVRSDYAYEFGGMGRNIDIVAPDKRSQYHGEAYEMIQNNIFNARAFFQVGSVQKSIRNQYGTSQSVLRRSAFSGDDTFQKGRGNVGRNTFRKDGAANFNVALARAFHFRDRTKVVTFRAEALNLTNHPQFDAPNSTFASPSFGQITNTLNAGRIMQFVLNMKF